MKANVLSCALKIAKNTSSDDSRVITCGFFLNFIRNEDSSHQYKHIHKKKKQQRSVLWLTALSARAQAAGDRTERGGFTGPNGNFPLLGHYGNSSGPLPAIRRGGTCPLRLFKVLPSRRGKALGKGTSLCLVGPCVAWQPVRGFEPWPARFGTGLLWQRRRFPSPPYPVHS